MRDVIKDFYRPIAENIRHARKNANLTQKTLAARIGLSRAAVANIESGRQQILLHVLYNIAQTCNIVPQKLLPEVTKQSKQSSGLKRELNKKLSAQSSKQILNRLKGA